MSDSASQETAPVLSQEETDRIANLYNSLKSRISSFYGKLGTLESDRAEHEVVAKTLRELPGEGRKCWHQVGGALVERTVDEMIPILDTSRSRMDELIVKLSSDLKATEDELGALRDKYNIIERNSD